MAGSTRRTSRTSSSAVSRPSESTSEPWARDASIPSAVSTWDAFEDTVKSLHAEPLAAAPLLNASEQIRGQPDPASNVKRADAGRTVQLVGRQTEGIDAEFADVEGNTAARGDRVGVHEHAALARDPRDLGDRLDRPDLGVRELDRHQDGVGTQRVRHGVGIDDPMAVDRHQRQRRAILFQPPGRRENRGMLDPRDHHVGSTAAQRRCEPPQRQVVRLGPAPRERDLARLGVDQPGDLFPRPLHRLPRPLTPSVERQGVPELLGQPGQHGGDHVGMGPRRGNVIQVNRPHGEGFYHAPQSAATRRATPPTRSESAPRALTRPSLGDSIRR